MLIRAGLEGVRRGLEPPSAIAGDPADMSPAQRRRAGVRPLPATLDAALDALEADKAVAGWFAPEAREIYLNLKRWEAGLTARLPQAELFARYARAY